MLCADGAQATCVSSSTNFCMSVNIYAGESGYYEIAGHSGVSPDLTVRIGTTYTFNQQDASNWYHAVGFAYHPDGAHGHTWGGASRDEIENAGELLYKINGAATTCPDAGATGLDCYEPEFFFPREEWKKKNYTVELTITQAMADRSHGGVIYYFCHIHSKMSGKIIIQNANGSPATKADGSALANPTQQALYAPVTRSAFDISCGTTGVDPYKDGGSKACSERFLPGTMDTTFEQCLQAIDCKMNKEMLVMGHDNHNDKLSTFMQQMIPHHINAQNMAKLLMKHSPAQVTSIAGLEDILWSIANVQSYQVHQFRAYLGGHSGYGAVTVNGTLLNAESVGDHCAPTIQGGKSSIVIASTAAQTQTTSIAVCTPSGTYVCVKVNYFEGESGYYQFAGKTGVSPDLTVRIGQTIVFDQRDASNWYHALGFAYHPDGAHGHTWGGASRDEIEGAGELLYKINGAATTCPDAGTTGLDCYEPEFFFPREEWKKKNYTVELTITQAMADRSHGGVIYYFCHIHSKMSGKIIIQNADGSAVTKADGSALANPTPQTLYAPHQNDGVDRTCGTYDSASYIGAGANACDKRFVCGSLDTTFEKCFQAIDCKMNKDMRSATTADLSNKAAVFMQQMIPHHVNAVNMARIMLKHVPEATLTSATMLDIMYRIVNAQNYEIHEFRNYLGEHGFLKNGALQVPSSATGTTVLAQSTSHGRAAFPSLMLLSCLVALISRFVVNSATSM
jgi:uncharacterized protein (DUF305 family)/plastocyanin